MMTLRLFSKGLESVPASTSWYLAELGEARGKQELFTRQSPQRLNVLREHALIESAVSSNRIEGIEIEASRIGTVMFGKRLPRDRNEEEIRGYRKALKMIHEGGARMSISEETVLRLHRCTRGEIWDAGKYKEKDSDIVERYPNGTSAVRFKTVPASRTAESMHELMEAWEECLREQVVHPLIAMGAFNLDFLCIHPFRDGNGRVSRLLLLLQCYHLGYEVGRYISLERLIEENRERYYETLQQSSRGWHRGEHDPWPYINFVLHILKIACKEFEDRLGQVKGPKGEKTRMIVQSIDQMESSFRVADIQRACPNVSVDMIRRVLKDLRGKDQVECLGRGQHAQWRTTKKWTIG